ncbi:MAG: hypothetical protein E7256_11985 [Lachnospiraceae bacterium]|nr:hypothetical protein [Lachnospiraceae bacterium]
MTVKEKEDNFYKMAIDSATAQNVAMVNEYKEQMAKESEILKGKVEEEVTLKQKMAMDGLLRENNTALSKKLLEARHHYSVCATKCKEDLFKTVEKEILAFCKTAEYQEKLKKQAWDAIKMAQGEPCVMEVMEADTAFLFSIGLPANVSIQASKDNFLGGIRVLFIGKKMILNQTYALKLEEVRHQFQFSEDKMAEV